MAFDHLWLHPELAIDFTGNFLLSQRVQNVFFMFCSFAVFFRCKLHVHENNSLGNIFLQSSGFFDQVFLTAINKADLSFAPATKSLLISPSAPDNIWLYTMCSHGQPWAGMPAQCSGCGINQPADDSLPSAFILCGFVLQSNILFIPTFAAEPSKAPPA